MSGSLLDKGDIGLPGIIELPGILVILGYQGFWSYWVTRDGNGLGLETFNPNNIESTWYRKYHFHVSLDPWSLPYHDWSTCLDQSEACWPIVVRKWPTGDLGTEPLENVVISHFPDRWKLYFLYHIDSMLFGSNFSKPKPFASLVTQYDQNPW